jgi:lipoyl(octanoyl) transferase
MQKGQILDVGIIDYDDGLELQAELEEKRKQNQIPDTLVICEHQPVYTMGRSTDENNLLLDRDDLEERGVKVREIRRGGDITFHGPEQLVCYPIIDLNNHKADLHWYLRQLERVIIDSLAQFTLECYTVEGMTGVWSNGGKVAAIGVGVSRWVTTHGFALNVNTDLSYFLGIIPCGIKNKPVTSMQALLRTSVPMGQMKSVIATNFSKIFGLEFEQKNGQE